DPAAAADHGDAGAGGRLAGGENVTEVEIGAGEFGSGESERRPQLPLGGAQGPRLALFDFDIPAHRRCGPTTGRPHAATQTETTWFRKCKKAAERFSSFRRPDCPTARGGGDYSTILETTPEPTVRPPSRMAKRRRSS